MKLCCLKQEFEWDILGGIKIDEYKKTSKSCNSTKLDDQVLFIDYCLQRLEVCANKTPIKVNKEGAFGETYSRDIYSGFNGRWYRKSCKEFYELKDVIVLLL